MPRGHVIGEADGRARGSISAAAPLNAVRAQVLQRSDEAARLQAIRDRRGKTSTVKNNLGCLDGRLDPTGRIAGGLARAFAEVAGSGVGGLGESFRFCGRHLISPFQVR
jgi:hypothetical protein